ncbi:MAG: multidrug transporter [Candidatus Lambdaproteobacteria bacterium RIFOXYD1_FULL_56_27]|uniref:Multidrug transporter n=1 Tax=Candidatus Lambdaproteobacteria bacterium RIFOXYD2_FULL_56_26 TaxID=1817773 RepID=A0A1F6GQI6_9PROT|nr:MAG: multidrug transporter [Candidatus Lambdaproteobacteria bacterium RIFOXYD2_FULL_56_26]OGH04114.1 MAG: multidrug transporter [Candidatus Lambdaproteobacteria bacterium RIFOXYC1_FULL_56_13]OGH06369.1 MAG: multidrug transporter [Candidatus Lambdaproteobacteria bacterium RIFOXYD1_FULL_56_27]
MPSLSGFLALLVAICFEVLGTTALKLSDGFTRLWPSLLVAVCYGVSFWLFSLALRSLPVGVAYSIWAGLGIVLVSLVGVFYFKQPLDLAGVLGMGLILSGVLVLRIFSGTGVEP